ncbi:hypothetical protein [Paracoccus laeviglucosivorans]|uniref:LTXXQ motif family protein n=1 Tax=Paracoccus laeviglucosivorans TaxID=1197861 RepID=A0A521FA97_9RHOB|nr:hypothetical protein [Paracoccus laeviglucosivorans]SMO93109.1 hypothetical protein SAMN06265221_11947 [Paracoccus laeviglucosivorans]
MKTFAISAIVAAAALGAVTAPVAVQAQRAETIRSAGPDMPLPQSPGIALAAHLAAAQVYLGIAPAQQEAWQIYCQALIAFLEPPPAEPDAKASLHSERMAHDVLRRADKAQALLDGAAALRGVLEPDQIARLERSEPGGASARTTTPPNLNKPKPE